MTNRQAAIKIVKQLHANGFEALLAGGCVRDMLLRRPAKDYDVATNAQPRDVIKLFSRTLKVGAKFGVIIVLLNGKQVEVATFRTEADYADGRHPAKVSFTTASQDAARRDFTINGMFYDPIKKEVVDYVNGRADLKKKLLRTIGDPNERFSEDYLRMLRAVRFATQLGFKIEPETFTAIRANADGLCRISGERIAAELEAILVNPCRRTGVALLSETGLIKMIFPALTPSQIRFTISVLAYLPVRVDFPLGLAALFADCQTDSALQSIRVLKLSRNQTKHIKFLLNNRGKLLNDKMSLAELKMTLAEPYFDDLYEFQKAIQKARGQTTKQLKNLKKRIKSLGDQELRPKPLLNGHELIQLGAVPGPTLGQLTRELYIAQLEGQLQSTVQAKQWAENWLQKHTNNI
jgi:tRNA nucleotidyltransferase/poly(A) polymerase